MIDVTSKRYAGFMPNDFIDGENVSVSFWTQGCPFHCKECHNPEGWNFNRGFPVPEDIFERLKNAIYDNGITRNFSILGGEPLCDENLELVYEVVKYVRSLSKDIKIFVWTGYTIEELKERDNSMIKDILSNINTLIDGRFEIDNRDITLNLRGSSNQRIIENPSKY